MRQIYIVKTIRRAEGFDRANMEKQIKRLELVRWPVAGLYRVAKLTGARLGAEVGRDTIVRGREMMRKTLNNTQTVFRVERMAHGTVFYSEYRSADQRRAALHEVREEIRTYRKRLKYSDDMLARKKPGSVLLKYHSHILEKTKKPTDNDVYVGIEIECILPDDADMKALIPWGKYISIVGDGSIEPGDGEQGREIRVCVKKSEVRQVIPGLVETLVSMGGRVNRSCGLHVHLDQRNAISPEMSFSKLVRSLGLLYTVIPASRRNNTYCKKNRHSHFEVAVNGDRYRAVNASAYRKHRTLEVRLFGGTLEAAKIINWVEVLHAITEGAALNRCPKNFDTAQQYWKLSEENVAWLKMRQAKFGAALADTVEAQSDDTEVTLEMAQNLEREAA